MSQTKVSKPWHLNWGSSINKNTSKVLSKITIIPIITEKLTLSNYFSSRKCLSYVTSECWPATITLTKISGSITALRTVQARCSEFPSLLFCFCATACNFQIVLIFFHTWSTKCLFQVDEPLQTKKQESYRLLPKLSLPEKIYLSHLITNPQKDVSCHHSNIT